MKVLVISSHYLSKTAGGEGERAHQLVLNLAKEKISFSFLTYRSNDEDFDNVEHTSVPYINERFKFPIVNLK